MGLSSGHSAGKGLCSLRLLTSAAARQGRSSQAGSLPLHCCPTVQRRSLLHHHARSAPVWGWVWSHRRPHQEMLGREWEHSPVPWQERGEPASVPPAAHPRICSLLRQTAGEGPRIVGQTLASAQSHQQEPPHQAPTTLRPWQTILCKNNRAQELQDSCRLRCPCNRDSGGDLEVAVPPILCSALWPPWHGKQAISDADKTTRDVFQAIPGSGKEVAHRIAPCSALLLMGCINNACAGLRTSGAGHSHLISHSKLPTAEHSHFWGRTAAS